MFSLVLTPALGLSAVLKTVLTPVSSFLSSDPVSSFVLSGKFYSVSLYFLSENAFHYMVVSEPTAPTDAWYVN